MRGSSDIILVLMNYKTSSQTQADKSWNVRDTIISQLFHYLQSVFLLDSSKLSWTRIVLAAKLYWVKMTEPVTPACKGKESDYTIQACPPADFSHPLCRLSVSAEEILCLLILWPQAVDFLWRLWWFFWKCNFKKKNKKHTHLLHQGLRSPNSPLNYHLIKL